MSRSRLLGLAIPATLTLTAATAVSAQSVSTPWATLAGCWSPVGAEGITLGRDGATTMMLCVIPINRESGVLARYAGDKVIEADTIVIGQERTRRLDDDCEVTASARFAGDQSRLYVRGRRVCTSGVASQTSGLLGLAPGGDLLDVREVTQGSKSAAVVQRYAATASRPELVSTFDRLSRAEREARVLSGAQLTGGDIIEAAASVDSTAVVAWLAERGQGFLLNAKTLKAFAQAQLPANVIDMMVALSNPKTFTVDRPSATVALRPREATDRNGRVLANQLYANRFGGWDPLMGQMPWGFAGGRFGWMNSLGGFGPGWGNGLGWGNGFGFGWDPFFNPWFNPWFGNGGVVVVGNGNVEPQRVGGRIGSDGYSGSGAMSTERAVRRGGGDVGYQPSSQSWGSGSAQGTSGGSSAGSSSGLGGGGSSGVSSGGYSSGGSGSGGGSAKGRPPL
jgi:hypothetical protein